jgi:hypothetical protein
MSQMINESPRSLAPKERWGEMVMFVPCFVVLLAVAILGQLIGISWRTWLSGAEGAHNIFDGIETAVYTFMSHIN